MAIAMTANYPELITRYGMHDVAYQAWAEREPFGRKMFNVRDTSLNREYTLTYGGTGIYQEKPEGTAVNYQSPTEGFLNTFTITTYADGLRFSQETWSDDSYGVMQDSPAELGMGAYATEETLLSNHFNNGFDSSFTGPDGVELFSTAHVRENGATYSNELSTAADLSTTSLEQALIDFRNFRSGGGRRLQIQPKSLLVPPDLQFEAARILESTQRPEDDTNASQPVNRLGLRIDVWQYLTDSDAWFLVADKGQHKLMLFERQPFTTTDVVDFDTGDLKFKGQFRQQSGWQDPRGVFGSPGA
jgi:hypothetical protein